VPRGGPAKTNQSGLVPIYGDDDDLDGGGDNALKPKQRLLLNTRKYDQAYDRTGVWGTAASESKISPFERRAFMQTMGPDQSIQVYTPSPVPLNSNLGISMTPAKPFLFRDDTVDPETGYGQVFYTYIDPSLVRDNVAPERVQPVRTGHSAALSYLQTPSAPNYETDRGVRQATDVNISYLEANPPFSVTGRREKSGGGSSSSSSSSGGSSEENYYYYFEKEEEDDDKTAAKKVKPKGGEANRPKQAEQAKASDDKKGASDDKKGASDDKKGAGAVAASNSKKSAPASTVTTAADGTVPASRDPRVGYWGYGDANRAYTDELLGNVQYWYDDVAPYSHPNFTIRSTVDHVDFTDPMDKTTPEYNASYSMEDVRAVAEEAYHRDQMFFREDMMAQISKKMNQRMWQTRFAPLRRDAFSRS
jgi:hypothetical protein